MDAPTTRRLTRADAPESLALGAEAFGYLPGPDDDAATPRPGRHGWGTLAGDRLLVQVQGLELASWLGGRAVPTTGIADVAVAAEARGGGLLDAPMRAVLADGRDRGEVVSTLHPTAPGIYRRHGYEVVGSLLTVELATASLPARRVPEVSLRRATADDVEAVRAAYDGWARAQDGPLTRRTPTFGSPLDGAEVTLAEVDGRVLGYLRWHRGSGYDDAAVLTVADLVALDGRAAAALWSFLAGWASVAPTVRLTTSGHDPVRLGLRTGDWRVVRDRPYMLRVTDVAGALSGRPAVVDGAATVVVPADAVDAAAAYRLTARDGRLDVEPAELRDDDPVLTGRGLALWYAGVQTCGTLRMAGLLTGPDHHDAFLDRVLERRPFHIRDYF